MQTFNMANQLQMQIIQPFMKHMTNPLDWKMNEKNTTNPQIKLKRII